jgi:hypothetical protein
MAAIYLSRRNVAHDPKARFRQTLRPMAARLAGAGVATNSELSKYLLSV